jgi:hypothetical protein
MGSWYLCMAHWYVSGSPLGRTRTRTGPTGTPKRNPNPHLWLVVVVAATVPPRLARRFDGSSMHAPICSKRPILILIIIYQYIRKISRYINLQVVKKQSGQSRSKLYTSKSTRPCQASRQQPTASAHTTPPSSTTP